jgi:hypothetical protein
VRSRGRIEGTGWRAGERREEVASGRGRVLEKAREGERAGK